jgi:DNA polymerase-3 subunit gamma/tau
MSYEVLARKYRPTNFEEVVGQDHIIKALVNSIDQKKIHQAYIFSGTRGVGKTTIARILAKCMNCESDSIPTSKPCNTCSNTTEITAGRSVDFLEIDAASNTQVEKIRELIETVEYKPAKGRYKIYLIDEVHMLSTASFNALLKTVRRTTSPCDIYIRHLLILKKFPKTVQSRCLQLNLKTVNEETLFKHFKKIIENEKIDSDDESLVLIANSANGSVRDGLTLLDQAIANGNGKLNQDDVKKLLGTIDDSLLLELIKSVVEGKGKQVFDVLSKIEELSPEYDVILKDIISILHQISLEHVLQNSQDDRIKSIATIIDKEFCQLLYEISMNSYSKFSAHPSPKEALEICLLRMLTFNPLQKLSSSNESKNDDNPEKKSLKKVDVKIETSLNDIKKDEIINSNDDWITLFDSLSVSPFARNYFGSMSFHSYSEFTLTLVANEDMGEVPENIMTEFKSSLKDKFSNKIDIKIQTGSTSDSPIATINRRNEKHQSDAENNINSDKDIQSFIDKFNGKIKSDTIKPIK